MEYAILWLPRLANDINMRYSEYWETLSVTNLFCGLTKTPIKSKSHTKSFVGDWL